MFRIAAAALALSLCAAPAALAQDGKSVYDLQCRFCHDDDTSAPALTGVHGRKIGGTSFEYSAALKAKEGNWDDASLDAFLKSPNTFAEGTKMQMAVTDDANRKAVIEYLKTLK